jgi:AraC-like DNA-binding protein
MSDAKAFWLAEADSYISECRRANSCLRASEFAGRMQRTPVQTAREFHTSVGSTLKDYLSRRQIECAKELLRNTRRSTAQIARECGYGTARTFYRAFRRSVGCSPTQFRERNVTGAS